MFAQAAWRVAGVAVAGLAVAAADLPRDTAGAEAHAQQVMAAQMVNMGAEGVDFHDMHAVPLPRAADPPSLAVCGTVWDIGPDPDGNLWGFHFIAFYEFVEGWAAPIGDPVLIRMEPRAQNAAALCAGAAATAWGRLRSTVAQP